MREPLKLTSQILVRIIDVLEVLLRLIRCHTGWFWVMFVRMVKYCQSPVMIFILFSVCLPLIRIIPREFILVFPTPSVSYLGVWDCVWGGCLSWWWDWWQSCTLTWWRWGWWGLTSTGWRRGRGWMWYFSSFRGRWSWWRCWCIYDSIYQFSSIFRQERGVPTTPMSHIDLLLGKWAKCSALGFYYWS